MISPLQIFAKGEVYSDNLEDAVCEQLANGATMSTIIQNTQAAYGVTLTATGISFLASFATIVTLTMIDRVGITTAMSKGTKGRLESLVGRRKIYRI